MKEFKVWLVNGAMVTYIAISAMHALIMAENDHGELEVDCVEA